MSSAPGEHGALASQLGVAALARRSRELRLAVGRLEAALAARAAQPEGSMRTHEAAAHFAVLAKQMGFLTADLSEQLRHFVLTPKALDAELAQRLPIMLSTKREIEMERADDKARARAEDARGEGARRRAALRGVERGHPP